MVENSGVSTYGWTPHGQKLGVSGHCGVVDTNGSSPMLWPIGVGARGQGIGPPLSGLGDNPLLSAVIQERSTKTCSELHNFSAKLIFFWGQAPAQTPKWGGHSPSPDPAHPFNLLNIYPPTFNLTLTPLLWPILHIFRGSARPQPPG